MTMKLVGVFLAAGMAVAQNGVRSASAIADGATHADWPQHGGTDLSWRYSALDQINTSNVKRLAPAWIFQTGDYEMGLQATPIEIEGVLYLSTSRNNIYALDAVTGRLMWQYKYPQPRGAVPYGPQNRGVAVASGRVFEGTYDNYVVALDQKTGLELWRVNVEDSKQCGCNITAAPLVVKDSVIVGGTGGDSAHRGYLSAFDAATGRLKWRFYTIPGPGEKGHDTWKGDSWKLGGGATWMTGSYDASLNLIYWGVGNAASDFYAADRTGDNLYTNSIVALDADTGKLRWHFQEVPKDMWDFDSGYECVLIDREVRGRMRKLLVHVNKGGFAFVLDRVNGEFIGAYPIIDNYNWITGVTEDGKLVGRKEPVENKSTYICPSAAGGKSWNQVAFSPRTGFLYTPSLEVCNDLAVSREEAKEGASFWGGNFLMKPPPDGPPRSHVDAYDAVTGKRQWTFSYRYSLLASMLATAGDLVFTGDPEGHFFALDARTGAKLWSFETGAGHRGSAIAYSVNGRQFVATPTGWGSLVSNALAPAWPEAETFRNGSTLMVFALPEESIKPTRGDSK
jgi:alcohol dehydrogenase (cytochrome c)